MRRIAAQIELLEPELRPQLLTGGNEALQDLAAESRFEWIAGRLGTVDLLTQDWGELWSRLSDHCAEKTGMRLLISRPDSGPTAALLQCTDQPTDDLQPLLREEQAWLLNQRFPMERLTRLGWQLQQNHWTEQLELGTGQELEQRWPPATPSPSKHAP